MIESRRWPSATGAVEVEALAVRPAVRERPGHGAHDLGRGRPAPAQHAADPAHGARIATIPLVMEASAAATAPEAAPAGSGSRAALAVLVVLVVLSPWAFGSVDPRATQAIALVSLTTALVALAWDARRGTLQPRRSPLWPLAGLWLLAVFQLVPLPESLHRLIAPGSAAVWHPDVPAAAAVLGPGPHPISLHPEATRRWLAFATGLLALALVAAPALRERRTCCAPRSRSWPAASRSRSTASSRGSSSRQALRRSGASRPSRPSALRQQEPLRRLRRARGAPRGGPRHRPRERGAPRPRLPELDREPRARCVVVAWGAAAILDPGRARLPLARRRREPRAPGSLAFAGLRLWSRRDLAALAPRACSRSLAAAALLAGGARRLVLPAEARDRVLTLAGVTTEQSGSYRLAVWRDTLRLVASSPLVGSGFGAFEDALPRFKTAAGDLAVEHAENDYLELAGGGRPRSAPALVAALAGSGSRPRPARRGEPRRRGWPAASRPVPLAGLVALAVHSAFDFNLRIPSNALLCAALVAVCCSRCRRTCHVAAAASARDRSVVVSSRARARHALAPGPRGLRSAASRRAERSDEPPARRPGSRPGRSPPAASGGCHGLAGSRLAAPDPTSRPEASPLAAWAIRLDPTSRAVREAASRLVATRRTDRQPASSCDSAPTTQNSSCILSPFEA